MLLEKWLLTVQPSTGASSATLYMFGNNSFGQLGNNSINFGFSPALIGTSSWTQISAGNSHTIAIRSDRTLWGWGYNNVGQLGNNDRSLINRSAPIQISTSSWNSISTNGDTTYAIRNDGSLFAWGLNLAGQMGNNQAISLWARNSWTSLAAGAGVSFGAAGLDSTGAMWQWGLNTSSQLGLGDLINRSSPTQVGTSSWSVVGMTKAVRTDGALFSWGRIPGNNTVAQVSSPIQVGSLFTGSFQTAYATSTGKTMASWTTITASGGIQSNGSLWLWGTNVYGEVGDGTTINRSSPVQIGTSSWTTIAQNIGSSTIVAIRSDSTIWAWGNNSAGQLGLNDRAHRSSPVQITSVGGSWTNVVSGNPGQVLARLSDGSLYGWGNNQFGQLGIGNTVNRSTPVQIIATGIGPYFTTARASAAIRTDGALLAWGYNLEGQLGLNDQIHRSSPVQVGTSSWSLVSASQFTTTAIRSDGGLFTWGGGVSNGLAIGTTINRSSPVQVTSLNTAALQQAYLTTIGVTPTLSWTILTGGFMQQGDTSGTIFGIKSDGSLWGWGRAAGGWLGQGDTIDRSSPVQIGTSSWTSIGIGYSFAAAIRSDGALFTWGLGTQGQLGQGDTISRSSPIQIGTSSWTIVSSSWQNMAALRTDGTLWSWGAGTSGAIGDGTTISRSSPIQIGAATNWTTLSSYGGFAANPFAFVINSTGALWGWGDNTYGQLGLGDTLARSSPVQIGTSSWSQVSAGYIATAAIRSDGGLFTWGNNGQGQLGDGTVISKSSPIQIGTQSWNSISAGVNTFARRSDNYVFAWGYNVNGQVGINSSGVGTNVSSPIMLVAEGAVNIAPSVNTPAPNTWRYIGRQNAGIDSNGNGFVWGPNATGQLGQLTFGAGLAVVPTFIRIGTIYDSWTQVSSEIQGSFAIRSDNSLWAWGNNTSGVLGLNNTTVQTSMQLVGTSSWSQVVSGTDSRAAALSNDNQLWRWGSGGTGQLGDGTAITRSSPTQVAASYNRDSWNFIGSMAQSQGLIRSDGSLFIFPGATGLNNQAGTFGQGDTIARSNPVQIPAFNTSWISIVGGGFFGSNAGIKSDGSLWTWGSNTFGQIGDGTTINKSSPVQIGTSSYIVVSGDETKFGITTAGTLIGWGANGNGQLGIGDTINRSGAIQIGSSLWVAVSSRGSAGIGATGAIRVDGQLFTWGRNNEGQLGAGTTISRSSPVQVGSGIWNKISSGRLSMYAINGAGSLFAWGNGSTGQLGDGTTISKSSPVQIGTSSWIMVSTNSSSSVGAIRKDSALFTWGANGSFQLGLGDGNPRSSPTQVGTSSWSIVNSNEAGMAAIRIDSKLFTWGGNSSGTVGDGTTVNRDSPVQIGTSSWVAVGGTGMAILLAPGYTINSPVSARGNFYTVPGGQLYAWGNNNDGELGISNTQNKSSPVQLGASSWTSVSSGASYSMAIRSDGQLFGWGLNNGYQLGDYTQTSKSNPVQISIPFNVEFVNLSWTQVSAGNIATLAIDYNGALWGWGSSSSGQLGQGTVATVSGPTLISSLFTYNNEVAYATAASKTKLSWTSVGPGATHVVAIKGNKLYSWGDNIIGQLGLNDINVHRSSPIQVGTSSWTVASAFTNNSAAIRSDGALFTWGVNGSGSLGLNDRIHRSSPVQVGTSSWTTVSLGSSVVGAIRSDGGLFTWGINSSGLLGLNDLVSRSSPVQVGTSSWTMVSMASSGQFAIRNGGSLFGWGINFTGQLGDGTTIGRSSPVQIGTSSWSMISSGTASAAIRSDFTLWTWGNNFAGALGDNTTIHRSSPVQLTSLSTPSVQASYLTSVSKTGFSWTFVSTGGGTNQGNSFAIRNDGRLFGWGSGNSGVIGDGTTIQKFSPVAIGTSSWSQVSVGQSFIMAIRNDGALFTWGNNGSGVLGLLDFVHRSSPVQVGTSSWIAICAGGYPAVGGSALAIRLGGSLYAWGRNDFGQIGDLTITSKSSPVQIGTSSWTSLGSMGTSGVYGSMAIRSDGGLFTWGYNLNGNLGLNDTTHRSSPVQVGTSSWSVISGMAESPAAIRLDGGLFAWGINSQGAVGDGTTTQRNSPVKIGTDSWVTVTAFNIGGGGHHAKRSDGLLFAWGNANRYTLGNGSLSTNSSSPVVISTGIGTSIVNISSAGNAALSIDPTGQMWAWGISSYGENARNPFTVISTSLPTFVPSVSDSWTFVDAGVGGVTGAVRLDGAMFAWGSGTEWAVGDGTSVHRSLPVQIGTGNSWKSAVWGTNNGLAVTSDSQGNSLFSWGINIGGQIGDGTTIGPVSSPIFIRSINDSWTSIAASVANSTAGVRSDGTLWAWGNGTGGQLGDGTSINKSRPIQIGTNTNWSAVYSPSDTTNGNTYALDNTGTAWAWGVNGSGELGLTNNPSSVTGTWLLSRSSPVQIGATPFSASPTQIGTSSWSSVSAGTTHVLAVRSNGSLFAWGNNDNQQLGDNSNIAKSSPVQIGTSSWNVVSAGNVHSLAIANDNSLYGWGLRYQPFVYDYAINSSNNFLLTQNNLSWSQLQTGQSNSIALRSDGAMFVWGQAAGGALNLPDVQTQLLSPTQVGSSSWTFVMNQGSGYGGAAIRSDGALFAWGASVPNNTSITYSSPVQIGTSSWTMIGLRGLSARRIDGALFTWGDNTFGQLGDFTTISRSSPVQVGTSSWTFVGYGCAIRSDGGLFSWGYNAYGTQGLGDTLRRSSPTQVGTSSWTMVATYGQNSDIAGAIRSDGGLFTWGNNFGGQLGLNDTTHRSSPVQVGTSSWTMVTVPQTGLSAPSGAIRSDGSLFTWGNTSTGDNTTTSRSSPVQIGTSSWTTVSSGQYGTQALRLDKSLWAWGNSQGGGVGGAVYASFTLLGTRSSPVQLPSYQNVPGKLGTLAWSRISAGYSHSVGVLTDGKLYGFGTMAAGNFTPYSWSQISASTSSSGAIRSDGALYMWGLNSSGQLGQNNVINPTVQLQVGTSSWIQVASIENGGATMAIRSDGGLFTWGSGGGGQLGNDTSINRSSPVQIGTSSWSMVGGDSKAIRSNGSLFSWGRNNNGEVGDGTTIHRSSPVQIGTSSWSTVSSKSGSGNFSLAIRSDGSLFSWGRDSNGGLGDGTTISKSSPVQIGTSSWSMVSALAGSIALRSDYSLWVWGYNFAGQLGQFDIINRSSPVQVSSLGVNEVSNSYYFATTGQIRRKWIKQGQNAFINDDNKLWNFGAGDGTTITKRSLVQLGTSSWTMIGYQGAIRSDGTLWMWESGAGAQWGANGDGTTIRRSSPVQVSTGGSWAQIAGAGSVSVAISSNGTLWAWGINSSGQLGDGTTINRSNPVQIGTSSWTAVAAMTLTVAAIRADGTLWAWGNGSAGILSQPADTFNRSSPVQIGTSSWTAIAAGSWPNNDNGIIAIRSDGALFTWGNPSSGISGDNNLIHRSSPVQIGTSSWTAVAAGTDNRFALRKDGSLWGWGNNANGQVGDGTTISKSSPVQIGTSSWSQLGSSGYYAFYLTGELYGWTSGQSGNIMPLPGNPGPTSSPVFITANTDDSWTSISSAGGANMGLRKDGMLFTWGSNAFGELGDGTTINRSGPVQIGPNQSTPWVLNSINSIAAGNSTGYVINNFPGRSIFAWGIGTNYRLAQNQITGGTDQSNRSSPVQIGTNTTLAPFIMFNSPSQIGTSSWSQVSAELNYNLAISSNGGVFRWGYNDNAPVAGITSTGITANTVSSNQISAGPNNFGILK